MLYNFNWAGTREEFREYCQRLKDICDGIEGLNLKEVFITSSQWTYAFLFESDSYDKNLEAYRTFIQKYGSAQVSSQAWTMLHRLEEVGSQSPF